MPRSRTISSKRSDSCAGRFCARYRIIRPSGEKRGLPSYAGLAAVRLRAAPDPSTLATQTSELVETASTLSGFAVKSSSFPSGETEKSLSCPYPGASRSPGVRSVKSPPPTATFQMCWRIPSFQLSQWRKRRRSAMRALIFVAARSFRRFCVQAGSAQSGKTSEEKTNHLPSGDQWNAETSLTNAAAARGSPPARSSVQICWLPPRFERKARVRPSGEKAGSVSLKSPVVRRRGGPPAAGCSQTAERLRFSSGREVVTA